MTTFQPAPGQTPPADAVHPGASSPDAPTSVSRLNETIRDFVQKWGAVWVEGEITSWNVRGGNIEMFTLPTLGVGTSGDGQSIVVKDAAAIAEIAEALDTDAMGEYMANQ